MYPFPHIIPIKELQNTSKIVKMVEESPRPIVVTKNGYDKLVILSTYAYQQLFLQDLVNEKLARAEGEIASGAPLIDGETYFKQMEKKYGF